MQCAGPVLLACLHLVTVWQTVPCANTLCCVCEVMRGVRELFDLKVQCSLKALSRDFAGVCWSVTLSCCTGQDTWQSGHMAI